MVTIAVIVFFVAGDALAFSDEPCSQYNYQYYKEPAMSASNSGWSITLDDEILPILDDDDKPTGNYEWTYTITDPSGNFTGANFVAFLIPDCYEPKDTSVPSYKIELHGTQSEPDLTCFDVSEGEPTIYFGRYNNQGFVCKGTPDNSGTWKIIANTSYKTKSTIIIKVGKDVLEFEMAVPGCPLAAPPEEPVLGSRTFSECSNFGQDTIEPFVIVDDEHPDGITLPADADDVSFYVIRTDDRDGCVSRIWKCIGHDCAGCTTAGCSPESGCVEVFAGDLPPNVVTQTSFIRTCPDENISVTHGSPFYLYSINSGGVTFESCLDLADYSWTSLTKCK